MAQWARLLVVWASCWQGLRLVETQGYVRLWHCRVGGNTGYVRFWHCGSTADVCYFVVWLVETQAYVRFLHCGTTADCMLLCGLVSGNTGVCQILALLDHC